ncbi:MAG: hypothetical protein AAF658_20735 [Myxococcota bacterium]
MTISGNALGGKDHFQQVVRDVISAEVLEAVGDLDSNREHRYATTLISGGEPPRGSVTIHYADEFQLLQPIQIRALPEHLQSAAKNLRLASGEAKTDTVIEHLQTSTLAAIDAAMGGSRYTLGNVRAAMAHMAPDVREVADSAIFHRAVNFNISR